jgi:DNA-binding beta-propeller fold protein YncE
MDDECDGAPISESIALAADPIQEANTTAKKPVRMIRDRYPSYSSVAVDPTNDEVVLTDENLFNILAYNRLDNTPATGITEPKRSIGGLKTKIEFQSGVYVDPKNGDIYAVNNDTVDTPVIFSRGAKGDVGPARELHTPHGTFGIAVDEEHQEVMLTVQHDSALVTFQKAAKSEDAPIRLLQGEHTLLADPHGVALDTKDDLIFVTNHGSVHQFRPGAVENRTGPWDSATPSLVPAKISLLL